MREPRPITRRQFCQHAAVGIGGLALAGCPGRPPAPSGDPPATEGGLPAPAIGTHSVAIALNSRVSAHAVLTGTASAQQIANILWAAGRAPITGAYRTVVARTGAGSWVYHPAQHALEPYSAETAPNALRINYDRALDFDAGVSYMCALLAASSPGSSAGEAAAGLASCPQGYDLNFGSGAPAALTSEAVAASSDGSLPDPLTDGPDRLADVLADLDLTTAFRSGTELTAAETSQVLWAAYGCTPHRTFSGLAGLTVPSWVAQYFLTNGIFVFDRQVAQYRNHRGADRATRDHRLELRQDADRRAALRQALPTLPEAPCYVALCLGRAGLDTWYQRLEVGFAAGAMLLQARALGLGCAFHAALTAGEQAGVQALGLPADQFPHAVVAVGVPAA